MSSERNIVNKLHESKSLKEENSITIGVNDPEGSIESLLKTISDYTSMGHSFNVVVDPGNSEYEKKFWIDGDGSDKMYIKGD